MTTATDLKVHTGRLLSAIQVGVLLGLLLTALRGL